VALLAFFGNILETKKSYPATPGLALALFIFVVGAALAGLATGMSFLAQYGYFMRRRSWFGRIASKLTLLNICLVLLSYISFISAGVVAYRALSYIGG
jgi:hypothetical protein